MTATNKLPPWK